MILNKLRRSDPGKFSGRPKRRENVPYPLNFMKQRNSKKKSLIPVEQLERFILLIRGQKVILDITLSKLYGVSTKHLNQQVKRNRERFPEDFMFRLTGEEKAEVVTNCDHLSKLKYSPTLPYAFTEHGDIMAANVLNTDLAIQMSVFIVRAFVKLRVMIENYRELTRKLTELERRIEGHDDAIGNLVAAIRQLMAPPEDEPPRRQIGFHVKEKRKKYGRPRIASKKVNR